MSWIGLEKPIVGRPIKTSWGRKVVEALDILHGYSAVDYQGYIHRDLVPDKDLLYSIGKPFARIKEIHAGYGYFTYDLFVQGKRVLKEGEVVAVGVGYVAGYITGDLIPDKDLLYSIGKPFARIREIHAGYGYFTYELFVQDKKVIKDGDPVNIYDIFEPAYEKIRSVADILKPNRSSPTQELSSHEISAGETAEIIKSNLSGWSTIVVTVRATYNANATNGVRVRWLFSPDGTNYDSVEDAEAEGNYADLTFSAGETRQRTILLPILTPYVKIQIVNLDSSYSVVVDVWTILMR